MASFSEDNILNNESQGFKLNVLFEAKMQQGFLLRFSEAIKCENYQDIDKYNLLNNTEINVYVSNLST
jgi:hypothetical protein